jgi:adenylate cyclase
VDRGPIRREPVPLGSRVMVFESPDELPAQPDPDRLFRTLVEQVPAVVYVATHDVHPDILYVSPQVTEMLGHPPDAWRSDPDLRPRTIHPGDRDRVVRAWADAVKRGAPFSCEYRQIHADGHEIWVRDGARMVRDQMGTPLYWHGVQQDISDRKRAELKLFESGKRYRALVEQLPAVVYVDTNDLRPDSLYISPNVEEILGFPADRYFGDRGLWCGTVHPEDIGRVLALWEQAFKSEESFFCDYRYVRPDGSIVWVRDSSVPIRDETGQVVSWQGLVLDVSAQQLAEQELRTSEAQFRSLVEKLPAVVYRMDPDDERRSVYVSPHVVDILGYTREEWLDQPDIWTELLHPDDREVVLAAYDQHNETGAPWEHEYRLIASDGQIVWVHDQAILVRDDEGHGLFWQGVMLDISERKELEERLLLMNDELELRVMARTSEIEEVNEMMSLEIGERRRIESELREAQDRYRQLVEDLPGVVYSWTPLQGEPLEESDSDLARPSSYISPQIEAILGYSAAEWGRSGFWKRRLHPHDRKRVLALMDHSERTGESVRAEYRYLAKNGHVVWVLDHATLRSRDARGRPQLFYGVLLDITARKQAEEKAADAEVRYRMLAEEGPIVPYIYELNHDVHPPKVQLEYVSPRTADIMGFPRSNWVADPTRWVEAMHPDDRARFQETVSRCQRTGEAWSHDYRMIAADGRIVWLHDTGRMVSRDGSGRPHRFQGVVLDITERKEEEERLRRSEAGLRRLVENLPVIPWTEVDDPATGRELLTYIGPQVTEVYGYTPDELRAEPNHFERMLHPDDRERVMRLTKQTMRTGEPWEDRFRMIARDGTIRHVQCMARLIPRGPGEAQVWHGVTVVLSDVDVSPADAARGHVPEDTDEASREAPPSRPPADGSRATR